MASFLLTHSTSIPSILPALQGRSTFINLTKAQACSCLQTSPELPSGALYSELAKLFNIKAATHSLPAAASLVSPRYPSSFRTRCCLSQPEQTKIHLTVWAGVKQEYKLVPLQSTRRIFHWLNSNSSMSDNESFLPYYCRKQSPALLFILISLYLVLGSLD